ncbi:Glycyl-tRNA synthetase family [Micractinium conductrix]|uniref:Glycine--tRNA ligase n=1 Tax=Micractinium conductrix TaxID=554055 RepID=A0A2P6VFF9_9CHLO|nr:Glycyl-tRNA synthetase family [Micractinium conductrix]|eukprot:PSC72809.1 Glycyl-tRNA synthetase family [Micractinium conductrix]
MDVSVLERDFHLAQEAVAHQGDTVRSLKAAAKDGNADRAAVDEAIEKLRNVKLDMERKRKAFEDTTGKTSSSNKEAFRAAMLNALERRLFFIPSFKIYGAVAGFYDYGPPGCAMKQNVTQTWRNHFILEENMLEVECPAVTPEIVLKASGHVERFTDFMVTDVKTGDCHRADHLLEAALEACIEDAKSTPEAVHAARDLLARVGELGAAKLGAALTQYGVKSPDTKNDISPPFPFNLMFKTSIGPRGDMVGYLRPETAQGIFVNFRDLLYYNGSKLPFAAAQIGNSYRNEISPRAGLLRVREFTQAEIEHFCNPQDKSHPKFKSVADVQPLLYSRALQMGNEKKPKRFPLGQAVSEGIIANETLAYFIGRTYLFAQRIGLNPDRVRFRQHLQHEMAHYAEDCWDFEVECSYGWVECAGLADRSAFDLNAHSSMSKVELAAYERFPEPREEDVLSILPNKKELGKLYKKDAKAIADALEAMSECDALEMQGKLAAGQSAALKVDGGVFEMQPGFVEIRQQRKKLSGRNFTPAVIEPSFGIGRILYCVFEHCFYTREGDDQRTVFRFTPLTAPVKCTVFPLLQRAELNERAEAMSAALTRERLSNTVDTTGTSIGKRYARTDEIGVPFAITVDYQSVEDSTATLRERDSTAQVRVPLAELPALVRRLTDMELSWDEVAAKYPAQAPASDE